jgi:uncharacterized protein (TIGR04255 family)
MGWFEDGGDQLPLKRTMPGVSITYANPPVIEVAAGLMFRPLPLRAVHLGLLWERFRDDFPRFDERPPLPAGGARVELMNRPPLPRVWFLKADGSELIQVQADRFIHNWRKIEPEAAYPRYDHVRELFANEFQAFREFLAEYDLGSPLPFQVEVTYVNMVKDDSGSDEPPQLGALLTVWRDSYSDSFLPSPETVNLRIHFPILRESSKWGRLTVTVGPSGSGPSEVRGYRMTLTGAGQAQGSSLEAIQSDMDLAHEWIVRGFTSITTEEMHRKWGLQ